MRRLLKESGIREINDIDIMAYRRARLRQEKIKITIEDIIKWTLLSKKK
jgi:hypothetical protein